MSNILLEKSLLFDYLKEVANVIETSKVDGVGEIDIVQHIRELVSMAS